MSLKVVSYNCRGLHLGQNEEARARRIGVELLLSQCDVLCLQETFLTKQDLEGLNSLSNNFLGAGESCIDIEDGIIRGRIPGGVAILWNKKLDPSANIIRLGANWCIGLQLTQHGKECVIINVYTPYECNLNEAEYLNRLAFISSFVNDNSFSNVFIFGDFNADIADSKSMFSKHLKQFCEDNELILSTKELLPADSFTYISEAWHTTSWLD